MGRSTSTQILVSAFARSLANQSPLNSLTYFPSRSSFLCHAGRTRRRSPSWNRRSPTTKGTFSFCLKPPRPNRTFPRAPFVSPLRPLSFNSSHCILAHRFSFLPVLLLRSRQNMDEVNKIKEQIQSIWDKAREAQGL